ncbi:uncharacterized protein N7477_007134 [Penicillium maclennaniae]|uniref:uncharacterized protein n=1 Tax=Penicillium maclennaniae TaxID=1343394 RepID=UPI00254063BE|nr:uncharacterized protein N7477_007134 [Penicillium maclennaniae]KAJ5668564.1 hypothetical protein N7477_007134 [Penicillium maclennaniae]
MVPILTEHVMLRPYHTHAADASSRLRILAAAGKWIFALAVQTALTAFQSRQMKSSMTAELPNGKLDGDSQQEIYRRIIRNVTYFYPSYVYFEVFTFLSFCKLKNGSVQAANGQRKSVSTEGFPLPLEPRTTSVSTRTGTRKK